MPRVEGPGSSKIDVLEWIAAGATFLAGLCVAIALVVVLVSVVLKGLLGG